MKNPFAHIICIMLLLCTAPQSPVVSLSEAAQGQRAAVLISREIAPYIQMVEGLETHLRSIDVERFFLDDQGRPYSLVASTPNLEPQSYTAIVAVGPEALRYLQPRSRNTPLIYAMILNPENVVDSAISIPCGISLNLPTQGQIEAIKKTIPQTRRLGILFDPANNAAWFARAHTIALNMDVELVPIKVETRQGRISIVGDYASLDALMFIPDKSIISKAVIRHVIKNAAARGVPVVGYNSFFYSSGAALVFSIDYTRVGEQTASLV
jgi:putative ABC transport system substrate-binding protein